MSAFPDQSGLKTTLLLVGSGAPVGDKLTGGLFQGLCHSAEPLCLCALPVDSTGRPGEPLGSERRSDPLTK